MYFYSSYFYTCGRLVGWLQLAQAFIALRTALMVIDHLTNISSSFKNILLLLTVFNKKVILRKTCFFLKID